MESISNTYTSIYTAENVGEETLGHANLKQILAALLSEYRIMVHSANTAGESTPQGAFHSTILAGLTRLGYLKIMQETAELANYITDPKFGASTIGSELGYMARRSKEDFDIRFDLTFNEQNLKLDECRLSVIIKAHRLFLAELCKKVCRSYNPSDIDPSKAVYRKFAGESEQIRNGKTVKVPKFTEHSSIDFVNYVTLLKQVYSRMYAYSDTLSEFIEIFTAAAAASKQVATRLSEERQKHRTKTIGEQRGSSKLEKKVHPKQSKQVAVNNTAVKPAPPPATNVWSERKAEAELAKQLIGEQTEAIEEVVQEEVVQEEVVQEEVTEEVGTTTTTAEDTEGDFVEVSRKKTPREPREPREPRTLKTPAKGKGASRAQALATVSA
jgi:hypothetical protein